jgi:uncharacterized membrane protein|tara:strand:- start:122 stop:694 length:573 start_codon:yes stop_codon:yes gene_type:complete
VINQAVYSFSVWLDSLESSTLLHESFYMYNWIESTHVLFLMVSLGMLFLIDLRMLGYAFPNVPASKVAEKLSLPMFFGFAVMIITGLLLFYAIPVRSGQSLWLRIKVVLLIAAAVNALLFHWRMKRSISSWDTDAKAPIGLRLGAVLSIIFWVLIVICGRLIAYDWFDCAHGQSGLAGVLAGCIDGQAQF